MASLAGDGTFWWFCLRCKQYHIKLSLVMLVLLHLNCTEQNCDGQCLYRKQFTEHAAIFPESPEVFNKLIQKLNTKS